jgi:hypothetical protein
MDKLQTGYSKITGKELADSLDEIYLALKGMNYKHSVAHDITEKIEKAYKKV